MTRAPRHGFTLVEIVVAMAILGVLLAVVYAGYALGVRSWAGGERTHAAVSELRLAGRFFRDRVEQAYPLAVSTGSGQRLRFDGDVERLSFVTRLPGYLGGEGLHEIVIAVDAREAGVDLSMSRRRLALAGAEPAESDRQRRLLVRDLESVRFDYFGSAVDGVPATWHPRWLARTRLPRLVRLRLTSRRVGEWPAIVVAVQSERPIALRAPGPSASDGSGTPSIAMRAITGSAQ